MYRALENAGAIKSRIYDMTDDEMKKFWGCVIGDGTKRVEHWLRLVQQNLRLSNELIHNNLPLPLFNGMGSDQVKSELKRIYIGKLREKLEEY